MRKEVKKRIRYCAAQAENCRLLKRDKMFARGSRGRYKLPGRRRKPCSRLIVNGKVTNGTQQLLDAWVDHFSNLAKSQVKDSPQLMDLCNQVDGLLSQSMKSSFWMSLF